MRKIAVFVGSLRKDSINRKLALALAELGKSIFTFEFAELGALPLYDDDLWQEPPVAVTALKKLISVADGLLFVTPEYNRSVPAVLKNAVDWGSRPWGQNSWAGKPAAIIGASPGNVGAAIAQTHLRGIVSVLDVIVLGQPEVYLAAKPGLFGDDGAITDESTRQFLEGFLGRFDPWVSRQSQNQTDLAGEK